MVAAMVVIPLVDGIAKHLSAEFSPLFISWARYAAACLFVVPLAVVRRGRRALPRSGFGAHALRTVFLVAAMTCYFIAIARIPLATALGAYFIAPILAMALAVVLLGERMTARKAAAGLLGLVGALAIVRPGGELPVGVLWALGAGGFFAAYIVATRAAAQTASAEATLAFQCLLGCLLLSPFLVTAHGWPDLATVGFILAMGALSALSHFLSISAFAHADASTLAPLVYVELVATTLVGLVAFGEWPAAIVWAGIAAIVAGGLLVVPRRKEQAGLSAGRSTDRVRR